VLTARLCQSPSCAGKGGARSLGGADPARGLGGASGPYYWPDNEQFRDKWCGQKFYGGIRRSRVLMISRALEEHYQAAATKGEPIVTYNFDALEIEHFLVSVREEPESQESVRFWGLTGSNRV
jgi:hypothetical protein